ncbi:hypothetical protein TCSYLVIO_004694 [Trypanosoma cruzi]|uniref:Uncharacterized protein n=2 Tax=Trypanosoma cruzi TaxID=5693 RepID=V5B3L6_TRYCR|nr:hypothetical protein TCSYLVIO_004694 [Trypanosoma cruzi]ESS67785.1 hypothetical protein TCDM_03497 [Trypanosoma cruzi Dm28c]PBJ75434.1 hypothetical protein BCY84_11262 [Trypanosoma cruzi cruzi]KAF8288168.1 hypothetical protein TcBrA4_0013390 [Trypanosoma cruzi]PWU97745.1 hypothetical protein C4B63_14g84 [Trypanosoma cruzi]
MCAAFRSLCEELSRLQVRMLRRDGNPSQLVAEATQMIRSRCNDIEIKRQNLPYVPIFLRSCATLFARADTDPVHEALETVGQLAEAYVDGNHGDVNESATVLQSLVSFARNLANEGDLHNKNMPSPSPSLALKSLLTPCLEKTLQKWKEQSVRPHTSTLLSLLRGTDIVYGEGFHFTPVSVDMMGLLPIKGKIQMEAKLQKCPSARHILKSLREMQLSKLDAGICLSSLAELGLYDAELCNACCEVLFSTHALVTCQQFAQVIYSLGVLQHRHIHQKFFSSMVDFKKCNAAALRKHTMGLAMLRQPPPNERAFMDGIFLHALRPTDPLEYSYSPEEELSSEWFVSIGHALSCLGIVHYKYRLMLARRVRRDIIQLTTQQRCQMLYALGGVPIDSVPDELRQSWKNKVERSVEVLTERLRYNVEPSDGPFVMNALLFAGVREHPMIPQKPDLLSGENPVEVLLRTWSTCPKERVLHLTEQIRPRHLGEEPTATLSHVFSVIAKNCSASPFDSYRFGPLCDAVRSHGGEMSVEEVLGTIAAIQRIGIGGRYRETLVVLLENLWRQRHSMTSEQQSRCCRLLERLGHLDTAMELLEYMTTL